MHAGWTLDRAVPIRPGDRVLHLRLTLPRCFESIHPVAWSRQPPVVREDDDAVALVVGARQRDADRCRERDQVMRLTPPMAQPLGDRAIVDADLLPPVTVRP